MEMGNAEEQLKEIIIAVENNLPDYVKDEFFADVELPYLLDGNVVENDGVFQVQTEENGIFYAMILDDEEKIIEYVEITQDNEKVNVTKRQRRLLNIDNQFHVNTTEKIFEIDAQENTYCKITSVNDTKYDMNGQLLEEISKNYEEVEGQFDNLEDTLNEPFQKMDGFPPLNIYSKVYGSGDNILCR